MQHAGHIIKNFIQIHTRHSEKSPIGSKLYFGHKLFQLAQRGYPAVTTHDPNDEFVTEVTDWLLCWLLYFLLDLASQEH